MIERCVCCGKEVPEGRQVCPACERAIIPDDCKGCPFNVKDDYCSMTGASLGGRPKCGRGKQS